MKCVIVFLNDVNKNNGEKKMCEILKKIRGKTSDAILQEYYGELTIPINIVAIAQNIGIELIGVDFTSLENSDSLKEIINLKGNVLGAVYIEGESVKVAYSTTFHKLRNASDNSSQKDKALKLKKRQRFTIAHEIAHCCLNHMPDGDNSHIEYRTDECSSNDSRERDANIFAGELLIPTSEIVDLSIACSYKLPLRTLSDLFCVSKTVMEARLQYLIKKSVLPASTIIFER